ncbi:MAG: hypothetical protein GY792_05570 [Gammaproteobacteria bacterium]|nr:hypothetical protein [Gammaproteobacteria bacterium]
MDEGGTPPPKKFFLTKASLGLQKKWVCKIGSGMPRWVNSLSLRNQENGRAKKMVETIEILQTQSAGWVQHNGRAKKMVGPRKWSKPRKRGFFCYNVPLWKKSFEGGGRGKIMVVFKKMVGMVVLEWLYYNKG